VAKTDQSQVNVLADTAPTISIASSQDVFENRNVSIVATVNTGRPVANSMRARFFATRADAEAEANELSGADAITTSISPGLPTTPNTNFDATLAYTTPDVSGTNRQDTYFLRVDVSITGQGSRNASTHAIVQVNVMNSIAAEIDVGSTFSTYEAVLANINFTFNPGSPTATEIRHSWHSSAAAATADTGEVTTNVPAVTLTHTAFSTLATRTSIATESGTISFMTPSVTSARTLYGRIEIVQDGAVVDFATYSLAVANNQVSSITAGNIRMRETEVGTVPLTYVTGQPAADTFAMSVHETLADAQAGTNALVDGEIPTLHSFTPSAPAAGTGTQTGSLRLRGPTLRSGNRTVFVRVEIRQGIHTWYDVAEVTLVDRVRASIDMPEVINIDESASVDAVGTYVTGEHTATAFGYRVYANSSDATNNENELTGGSQPLTIALTPSRPDPSGDRAAAKTLTARITAPAVTRDEDYFVVWSITQHNFPEDPPL